MKKATKRKVDHAYCSEKKIHNVLSLNFHSAKRNKKEHIGIYYLPTQIRNFRIIPKLVFKFHISKLAF